MATVFVEKCSDCGAMTGDLYYHQEKVCPKRHSSERRLMTPHVTFKPGAKVTKLAPAGIRILAAIDQAARYMGRVITITSGSESRGRDPKDPHMTGEAFDVSVNGLDGYQTMTLYKHLTVILGLGFTVLLEAPVGYHDPFLNELIYRSSKATGLHIHVQRKKATTWPPAPVNA